MSTTKVRATRDILKAARVYLRMEQDQLAEAAGLSRPTVSFFERGLTDAHESTREKIQTALENRGIVFTNGDQPGFRHDPSKAIIPSPL